MKSKNPKYSFEGFEGLFQKNDDFDVCPIEAQCSHQPQPQHRIIIPVWNERNAKGEMLPISDFEIHINRIRRALGRIVESVPFINRCFKKKQEYLQFQISEAVEDNVTLEGGLDEADIESSELERTKIRNESSALVIQSAMRRFLVRRRVNSRKSEVMSDVKKYWFNVLAAVHNDHKQKLNQIRLQSDLITKYANVSVNEYISSVTEGIVFKSRARIIQRNWRLYLTKKTALSPHPEVSTANVNSFSDDSKKIHHPHHKKEKDLNKTQNNHNSTSKIAWAPQLPAPSIKYDLEKYVDHPPKSTYKNKIQKVKAYPNSQTELYHLLHGKNTWVGIPTHLNEHAKSIVKVIRSPYLAPAGQLNDLYLPKKEPITRDEYLMKIGWDPGSEIDPTLDFNKEYSTVIHGNEFDSSQPMATDDDDNAKGFYESKSWDIGQRIIRGAYKPPTKREIEVIRKSNLHQNQSEQNKRSLIIDLLFKSAALFSNNTAALQQSGEQYNGDVPISVDVKHLKLSSSHKPPMKFGLGRQKPRHYVPGFAKRKVNFHSKHDKYLLGAKGDLSKWKKTPWGRLKLKTQKLLLSQDVTMSHIDESIRIKNMDVYTIRDLLRTNGRRITISAASKLFPSNNRSQFTFKYTWLPRPLLSESIRNNYEDIKPLHDHNMEGEDDDITKQERQPLFLTDLDHTIQSKRVVSVKDKYDSNIELVAKQKKASTPSSSHSRPNSAHKYKIVPS